MHFVNTVGRQRTIKSQIQALAEHKASEARRGQLTIPEVGELVEVEVVELEHVVHGQSQDWIWECRRHCAPRMWSCHHRLCKIGGSIGARVGSRCTTVHVTTCDTPFLGGELSVLNCC